MALTQEPADSDPFVDDEALTLDGLRADAVTGSSSLMLAISSTAPAYSVAATLGILTAAVGSAAPAVLLVALVPMFCIAMAYRNLNEAQPDCGTTFTWATAAMGPAIGWVAGWAVIVAQLVSVASEAEVIGTYVLSLAGVHDASTLWTTVLGTVAAVGLTYIAYVGIAVSMRTQAVMLFAEMAILALFVVVALYKVYALHPAGSSAIQLSWFWPGSIPGFGALSAGLVAAVFLYWGWDTAFSVNEETVDARHTPGRAALVGNLILAATYTVVAVAAIAFAGPQTLTDNSDDALGVLGEDVFGSTFDKLLIIAVLTSSAATLLTTVLPNARTVFAMGRRGALPSRFGRIDVRHRTPAFATAVVGAVSVGIYLLLSVISTNVLYDTITAIGLEVTFYYVVTGLSCLIIFRRDMWSSLRQLMILGILPSVGTVTLGYVFMRTTVDNFSPEASSSGGSVFGVGVVDVIGIGGLLLGVVLMILWRLRSPDFFTAAKDDRT